MSPSAVASQSTVTATPVVTRFLSVVKAGTKSAHTQHCKLGGVLSTAGVSTKSEESGVARKDPGDALLTGRSQHVAVYKA